MADNIVQEPEVNETFSRAVGFWEKFKKPIIVASVALILIVAGYYAYNEFYKKPNEEKAAEAMFKAEGYFAVDSLATALNGDGVNKGFLYIMKNYSGTKAANLSHYYAGIIYLRTGDFKNAVEHLKDFDTDAKQIQMLAYGHLGDAYSEMGKKDEAVDNYEKAGKYFPEDEINSSEFLFRAGLLLETMNKNKEAVEIYKELKTKYPKTEKGFSADKYIYRLSNEKNEFSVK